jgi:hypothetical protein
MLIRANHQTCFVILRNGLTLELVYGAALVGGARKNKRGVRGRPQASHGVWLMGRSVLSAVKAGQA